MEKFLYEELDTLSKHGVFSKESIPSFLKDNLRFKLRPYQEEAFARFIHYFEKDFSGKTKPLHLGFNMATGSGKTLIMAGLILYLYKKGYRNFLFFVNSSNIIEKTKSNFLDSSSSKYLFKSNITLGGKRVSITPLENFEDASPQGLNIVFTTVQKLHSDLNAITENALCIEDFKDKKIVLLSDEAHHISAKTKEQKEFVFEEKPTWENTVEKIFHQDRSNLLLEFTATLDYAHKSIAQKYRHKVLYRYDLKGFRNGGWSKDVYIIQADFEQKDRILQALILNQYKQEVATKYQIRLKPVILFKAQKTIQQNKDTKKAFHNMIENLSDKDIMRIRDKSHLPVMNKAFAFFESQGISPSELTKRLREEFQPNRCLSVNEESEKERYQMLLNTLEDEDNLIRAIFAVEKLNEGWDVLNLFDIVRCYETKELDRGSSKGLDRESEGGKIGKTTMKEAQLIGRGARYFPFLMPSNVMPSKGENNSLADNSISAESNPYKRKFDHDLGHNLRILEELHYHSINDNKYISEITKALVETGIMEEQQITKQLKLKDRFKQTDFYKKGLIYINKRVKRVYDNVQAFSDMGISSINYQHRTATGSSTSEKLFSEESGSEGESTGVREKMRDKNGGIPEGRRREIKVKELPFHIVQNAISMNNFFTFCSLEKYFPKLQSIKDFIEADKYLGGLSVVFEGKEKLSNKDILEGVLGLLDKIKNRMLGNITEYRGTEKFKQNLIRHIFTDTKEIKVPKDKRAESSAEALVSEKDWYVFKAFYGTSEERAFIRMLDREMDKLKLKYDEIYLIRNERHFKIYNFKDGRGFEPDFVLFLRQKAGKCLSYQMFIEPKGKHLKEYDQWKEDFLKEIREKFKGRTLDFTTVAKRQKYRLTGVPFYNNEDENQFKKSLYSALNEN